MKPGPAMALAPLRGQQGGLARRRRGRAPRHIRLSRQQLKDLKKKPYFGSMMTPLTEGSFRCVSANMSNLPVRKDDPKTGEFAAFLKQHSVGIFMGQEHGLNDRVLAEDSRLNERLQSCFAQGELKVVTAYNSILT